MNITISAKDFRLTPSLKQYVEHKFTRLARFHPAIKRIGVELDVDKNARHGKINRIEIWAYLPHGDVQAGMKAEHMMEAIDLVYPKIERLLVKDKELMMERRRAARKEV